MKRRELFKWAAGIAAGITAGKAVGKPFNAADFVDGDAAKENLEDVIYHISPVEPRFQNVAYKGDPLIYHEWTEDYLETPINNPTESKG